MLPLSLVFTLVLRFHASQAESEEETASALHERNTHVHHVFNTYLTPLAKMNKSNINYYEDGENMLRVPNFKISEHQKSKKKSLKKIPKRMIQKIIKKSKTKTRKMNLQDKTSTTQPPQSIDEKPEEDKLQKSESTTTPTQKKKVRKWTPKRARYPLPFQTLKKETGHKRNRRETNRSDVYIIQDLDEVQFIDHQDGNDIVEAHIKKYW